MATLEKIRSKSGLLIVVIGLALLAFIIGDALTNSRNLFGDHTTVAKVGDVKIDYTEYQRKREELNSQLEEGRRSNPEQYANFDTQLLAQMAIDQLITEKLVDRAVKKLGLRASGDQLRYYMLDNPINPQVQTIVSQLQQAGVGVATPAQAYEVIFNPKRNGLTEAQVAPFQQAWLAMEEDTKVQIQRAVYQQLLLGSIKANDLDKHALHNDYVATAAINVAFKGIGTPDPKKYAVSDADIKKAYDAEKERFAVIEPTKSVSYIAVNIAPSDADIAASRKLADVTAASLRDSAGQLSRDARKEGVVLEHRELRASDIANTSIRNYVATAPRDSVSILANGLQGFTVVRMGSCTAEPDSIELTLVQVAGAQLPDKVMAALNSGLPVDSVSKRFSSDSVMAVPGEWIELINASGRTQALTQAQLDTLQKGGNNFVNLINAPEGAMLAKITKRSAPVEIYSFDEVNYSLKPSTATVDAAMDKLEKYLSTNTTAQKFSANAAAAGYTVQTAELTQSAPALPRMAGAEIYYPESRQVVRWAMIDGKPGQVSHIYECKDASQPMLYAIAVDSEYEDYIPATHKDVKEYLTAKLRADKAASDLLKQYEGKGKSVAEIAAAMQTEPAVVEIFRFAPNGNVRDAKVAGRIMGTKAGSPMQIVKGQDGIYAFEVKGAKAEQFPYNDQQYTQQYFMLVNPQAAEMLRSGKKMSVKAYKFEGGD